VGSLRNRLGKLERTNAPKPESPRSGLAAEVRALDAGIRELDEQIAGLEATTTEGELRALAAEDEVFTASPLPASPWTGR
jgi:hypothetical protein